MVSMVSHRSIYMVAVFLISDDNWTSSGWLHSMKTTRKLLDTHTSDLGTSHHIRFFRRAFRLEQVKQLQHPERRGNGTILPLHLIKNTASLYIERCETVETIMATEQSHTGWNECLTQVRKSRRTEEEETREQESRNNWKAEERNNLWTEE